MREIISETKNSSVIELENGLFFDPRNCTIHIGQKQVLVQYERNKLTYSREYISRFFLNIVHDCNMVCDYCYESGGDFHSGKKTISLEKVKTLVEQLNDSEERKYEFNFFGGEPLIRLDLIEKAISIIKQRFTKAQISFSLVTNATIFNKRVHDIISKNNIGITLSIDGYPENNDRHRKMKTSNRPSSEIIFNNLPKFLRLNNKLSVRIVITADNVNLLDNVQYLYQKGVKVISFRPVYTKNSDLNITFNMTSELYTNLSQTIKWYFQKILENKDITLTPFDDVLNAIICKKMKKTFCNFGKFVSVSPEGEIFPCSHFVYNYEYLLGTTADFAKVEEESNKLTNQQLEHNQECENCWIFNMCGGGCKAASFYYFNDITSPDDACLYRKFIVKTIIKELLQLYRLNKLERFVKNFESRFEENQEKRSELYGERFA
ncbi:MAG: radical SAM protein [Candidatus Heimdallarchaeaceae archaeon]